MVAVQLQIKKYTQKNPPQFLPSNELCLKFYNQSTSFSDAHQELKTSFYNNVNYKKSWTVIVECTQEFKPLPVFLFVVLKSCQPSDLILVNIKEDIKGV